MRTGGKVAGEPTKKCYEAPAGDNTSERGEVCLLRALVACKQSVRAKEFSQHRHRSFRLVIASLQMGPTAQR